MKGLPQIYTSNFFLDSPCKKIFNGTFLFSRSWHPNSIIYILFFVKGIQTVRQSFNKVSNNFPIHPVPKSTSRFQMNRFQMIGFQMIRFLATTNCKYPRVLRKRQITQLFKMKYPEQRRLRRNSPSKISGIRQLIHVGRHSGGRGRVNWFQTRFVNISARIKFLSATPHYLSFDGAIWKLDEHQ